MDGELPLHGLRVLDLTDEPVVLGARLLADLGADVVRVESPPADDVRSRPPFLDGEAGPERSYAHLLYNGGKRSLALDLRAEEAEPVLERLLGWADVALGPLSPTPVVAGALRRASIPLVEAVFRREAPEEVATDLIGTAAGGLLWLTGVPEDPPNYPAGNLAYKQLSVAAAEAAIALVSACRQGEAAGRISVSMQEAIAFTTLQTNNQNYWHWLKSVPHRSTPLAGHTIFKSQDGKWVSFTIHPPHWPRYVDWVDGTIGAPALRDPAWDDERYRGQQRAEIGKFTARLCAALPRDELLEQGQARGLLLLPVNNVAEIAEDPHLNARGFYEDVEHPQFGRRLRLPRAPFLSSTSRPKARRAPVLGEHSAAVLREAGLEEAEIASLAGGGVITIGPAPEPAPEPAPPPARRPAPARSGVTATKHQPLKGVRILDFCWAIAGSLGTRLLADLGADVIKIESEYRLDPVRYIGVQPGGTMSINTNGVFNDCSANKRAVQLNLNTPEGVEIAKQLAATADVISSNYTPDRLDRWGLSYEALKAIKPDIIVANLSVMGVHGPRAGWRSYGSGIVAMCGLSDLTGFPGRTPQCLGTLHTDFTVPYFAAAQILAALEQRARSGEGQYLEMAQYESAVHLLDTELVEQLNGGPTAQRRGNRSARFAPHGVYPAAGDDRWVAVACRDDADWARLREVIADQRLQGPELKTLEGRQANEDVIDAVIGGWTRGRDAWDAADVLQAAGIPASPVETLEDLQTRDAGMASYYQLLDLPEENMDILVQHEPILWNGERLPLRRAPRWNEHTETVLRDDLGLDAEAIAALAAAQVLY